MILPDSEQGHIPQKKKGGNEIHPSEKTTNDQKPTCAR